MTKVKLIALIFVLLLITACKPKPDAIDSNGNKIYLSDYQGKWLVINYWATWCKPCLTELPDLNALYNNHANQVMVFGMSFDALSNAEIQQFAKKLSINFPMLQIFPIGNYGITNISALPVTFLISPQGRLVKTLHGPQTQTSLLTNMGLSL